MRSNTAPRLVRAGIPSWLSANGPRLCASILALLVALDVSSFVLRGKKAATAAVAVSPLPPFHRARGSHDYLPIILAAHLAGTADPGIGSQSAEGPLKLAGIIATDAFQSGYAIIVNVQGVSHLYRSGSEVASGTTLQAIFPDHVVLLQGGAEVTLRLPHLATPTRSLMARVTADSSVATAQTAADDSEDRAARPLDQPRPLPTSGAVLRSLRLRPALESGERTGMRVEGGNEAVKSLAALGLTPGDVILSVNGTDRLQSIGGDLVRAINSEQPTTLAVERDGRMIDVIIDPATATAAADFYRGAVQP